MKRRHSITRLEALSDGVFAFAATLLVVSLEVPTTLSALSADLSGFGGFAFGFGALMLIWTVHHAYFRRYGIDDGWTVALNSLLLLVVLFYVYPLKFVAGGLAAQVFRIDNHQGFVIESLEQLGQVFRLYSLGFVGVFLIVALMYLHAYRMRGRLGLTPFEAGEALFLSRHYLIFAAVGIVSIVLASTGLGLVYASPGWIYFLLGPLCWLHGVWSDKTLAPLREKSDSTA